MKSSKSKVLHELFGRTMLEYVLDAARQAGATKFLIVIGHEGEAVQESLAGQSDVEFVWQHNPQGTGHAVQVCEEQLKDHDGTTLVLAGDTPLLESASLKRLLETQQEHSASAVIGSAETENNYGLGRVVRDTAGNFLRIVEQKDASEEEASITEINTGCYAFSTTSLVSAMHELKPTNKQGELYLTDVPAIMLSRNETVHAECALTIEEALGVNTRDQLAQVRDVLHRRGLKQLMSDGAGIVNPDLVDIDPRTTIGRDTIVHPFTVIKGPCDIGAECVIGPHAIVDHCALNDGETVNPFEHRTSKL